MMTEFADPSNWGNGAGGPGLHKGRELIIMHGTGKRPTASAADELAWLRRAGAGVSYHWYIEKDGAVHQLVPNEGRAWHAGSSKWLLNGKWLHDLNDWSVGVALESSNAFDEEYPTVQVHAALQLVQNLLEEYGLRPDRVLTHREVSEPAGRKIDPVNFDIDTFRAALGGPIIERLPAYHPVTNQYLGDVTVIDGRKVYAAWFPNVPAG